MGITKIIAILLFAISIDGRAPCPKANPGSNTTNAGPPEPPTGKLSCDVWPREYSSTGNRNLLAEWLFFNCQDESCSGVNRTYAYNGVEYPGYDGWYNNLARQDSGAIDRPLLRRWPAAYADGSYEPSGADRPNPMVLSQELLNLDNITLYSESGKTAFLVFFGQQLVEEVLDAQRPACPPEYFNIPIPEGHRLRNETGHTEMPLLRTRYDMRTGYSPNNPRQQLNEITPYLDGGLVYGTSKAWADYLRTDDEGRLVAGGKLAGSSGGLFPALNKQRLPMANPPPPAIHGEHVARHETPKVERFFKLGNPRGNENTFLLAFGILLFRWHNYLAENIKRLGPHLRDEEVFNEARKWTIATHQHIVVDQWLPVWLGRALPPYRDYDPAVDPQIDQFFQAAAMRFGHTLVVPAVYLRDYQRNGCNYTWDAKVWPKKMVRTCNAYWRPQDAITSKLNETTFMDIDRVLMGLASQSCGKEDNKIVEDLRGNVFGPLEFSRRDLMAINIQRARDHGLPDFNTARKAFGLPPVTKQNVREHYKHLDRKVLDKFIELHNAELTNVDPWVGGILETKTGPGQFFAAVISDQFRRIRDGDRFWFENKANGLFTDEQITRIKNLDIYDIVMAVTKMDQNDIPEDPFLAYKEIPKNCEDVFDEFTDNRTGNKWYALPALTDAQIDENCTTAGTYDYFNNSEISYILSFTFIGAFIAATLGAVVLLTKIDMKKRNEESISIERKVRETYKKENKNQMPYAVKEWTGPKNPLSSIVIILDTDSKKIRVCTQKGNLVRAIDFSHGNGLQMYIISDKLHLLLRMHNEYDLVLKFDSDFLRENFLTALERFTNDCGIERERINWTLKPMYKQAVTKVARQKQLDKFFRVLFAQAFNISHSQKELSNVDSKIAKEMIYTELTLTEFADALSMKQDSEFVQRIFNLIDKDKNGFVSFREFLDLLYIFYKGTPEKKAQLLFDMYDINKTEFLTEEDFKGMIKSLMETCHASVSQADLDKTIDTIKLTNSNGLTFKDFYKLFKNEIDKVGEFNINLNVGPAGHKGKTYLDQAQDAVESLYLNKEELVARIEGETLLDDEQEKLIEKSTERENQHIKKSGYFYKISRHVESNFRELFWMVLFTLVLLGIFIERAYYYTVEREHSGLRRIAGYGVTITRGAASAQMFTYSVLLLTMCRNTISALRGMFLFIPFDRSLEMHKYVACWALFFTLLHIVGHAFNFYHISTQTADDLTCLFRNYFHATHELPKFHYWCWQTMTGITGVILTLITAIIFICAIPGISRNIFWNGHKLYPLFYIFMVLHGSGRLIQAPYFPYFFIGPLVLFIIDNVISASRKKVEIRVLNAELLPSGVTKLEFKRPNNFEYKSGQWVKIACLGLNASEFHPFTLSSSPDEVNLTVHIRAVGPWTRAIRTVYDPNLVMTAPLPKIHLDGPYGEGHQDWYRYDVSVLVGGGIGVTPFASILKDIVFQTNRAHKVKCKKVYFIWVTRTQRQFEWLVDIIRELEAIDVSRTVSTHLFITQFYHKFDLRTTLLYICERHFQRVSGGRSLFSGLRAVTHFGRPTFAQFFRSLQQLHPSVSNIGVFSCGPAPMTSSVDKACLQVNKCSVNSDPTFEHHYKNF